MLERVHVLRAHSCELRHGALLRAKATGLAAASSLSREREGERERQWLPSKRPDWMTLNFRSCAPVTGIECRVCRLTGIIFQGTGKV